ncbi:MAG: capsule assembly Wzi family protein, partial [Steroidobacteraceae bacterium]
MKRGPLRSAWAVALVVPAAFAGGVSAYLPLNLDPRIERQVERVLVLAGKPVLKRPIPIAWVRAALPKACAADLVTCRDVETYLERVAGDATSAQTSIEGAASNHTNRTVPNRYGLDGTSPWVATAALAWQPRPYLLASAGAVAYDGEANPTGSMLSVGFDRAQLDLGYRPHWFSPMTDSSMLISTEAPTMPSATLSNVVPLTRAGFQYELFMAEMSQSDRIAFRGGFTSGKPRLAGVHLSMEPASGWALGVNRLMQYGGGARGHQSLHDLVNAFFNPGSFDNVSGANLDNQFGNQLASVTSRFLFPGKTPFAVYFEYAGEDTSRGRSYLLGNAALSAGLHFPRLAGRFDLTLEASEWQNGWYTNALYGDGLTNRGHVIGNWVGDMRRFGDDVGGQSAMARLAWDLQEGADLA